MNERIEMLPIFTHLNLMQINRLFPFYFVIDSSLNIPEYGRSLDKIVAFSGQNSFFDHFGMMRPHLKEASFEALLKLKNQLIVLNVLGDRQVKIRGQFEFIEQTQQLLFVGSPWFNDINELQTVGLSLFDFAFFDPLADLLQVVKNQQLATADIKLLLTKIKQQKQALETTTKELQENHTRLQLLSSIAEKTINGVIMTDRAGRIEWVNDSFTRISGYNFEEVVGKKPGEVLQGVETNPKTVAYLSKQIKKGLPFSCELLNYHKNGASYWIKIVGNPITDADGQTIGFFALEEDITTQVKTEQALRDAKEKSDAIAHSKNIFLTNMSHEMRTPLNAILGMGQQLQKTDLSEQQSFFLDTMKNAAEHLLVVINDILDISRIDAGKLNLEAIDFNLRALIQRCFNVLMPKAEEKGLLFKAYIDNDVAEYLVGDPHRINQILLNLLNNALKFTEQGKVQLFVSCLKQRNDVQTIRFAVEDTGIGIEETFINQLFNEFSQEDSSIVRKYGGTGLGLNITKKLVSLMDGTIVVNSQKNEGTTFTVEFDLPIGSSQNIPQEIDVDIDPSFLKNKTILLVEDNEMNRILARTILQTYQVQLIEVDNGLKAVEIMKQQGIDLILMDIQMPIMDGIAATQHIRNDLKLKTPILALTANALKGEREKCLAAGMNEYISKPFREKELINMICKLLDCTGSFSSNTPLSKQQEATEKRPYSFDYLNETSGNSADFVKEMVDIFILEAQTMLDKMPALLENHNFDAVRSLAHKFKSNLYMLEINDMAQLAQTIEQHKQNEYSDFKPWVEELISGTQNVLELLSLEEVS